MTKRLLGLAVYACLAPAAAVLDILDPVRENDG